MKSKKSRPSPELSDCNQSPSRTRFAYAHTELVDQLCDIAEVCDAYEMLEELMEPRGSLAEDIDRKRLAATLRILNSSLAFRLQSARELLDDLLCNANYKTSSLSRLKAS